MSTFRPYEPDQQLLLPPSLRAWLPPDHLVWFISETVDQLDLGPILETYREGGSGNLPYHPAMMLKILVCPGKPKPKDQENFTDPESRIMKDGSGAFQQCYNAEVAVDGQRRIIVAASVQQSASDAPALIPMVEQARRNVRRRPREVLADAGYASEANLRALERRKIGGYVALGREAKRARAPGPRAHPTRRMARTLRTKRGRTKYKQRKHVAEPPFGWIKRGLGFRQFSLRGLSKVTGEFKLVCLALNLRRMQHMMQWK